jgi:hypothetical protein
MTQIGSASTGGASREIPERQEAFHEGARHELTSLLGMCLAMSALAPWPFLRRLPSDHPPRRPITLPLSDNFETSTSDARPSMPMARLATAGVVPPNLLRRG